MLAGRLTKLFKNGASQAVRLPMDFRFDSEEIYILRDNLTGDVTLSERPGVSVWKDFFDFIDQAPISDAFMNERPLNALPQDKKIF